MAVLQRSSLTSIALPPHESRAMDFYVRVVAIEISGWQYTPFWSRDVIRMAETDCSVRYALVSLSAFYESICTEEASQEEKQQCGLKFYNMAITSLYRHFESPTRNYIAIVVCIIFICSDLLRGEHLTAMKHFEGSLAFSKNGRNPVRPISRTMR